MPDLTVVVPWRPGCEHRARAWRWVRGRYAEHPGWEMRAHPCPPGPWVKAKAVMPAVESARTDIVVVADADVWCDGLPEAAEAVRDGAAWAVPHRLVHRLTETATRSLIAGGSPDEYEQRPYPGVEGGGVIVTRRDTLLEIPLDPRFVGWGQEDVSHGVALRTLLGGCWRGTADLIHLWHPPQERLSRKVGSLQGRALGRRYFDARRSPDEMRALLAEVL